MLMAMASGASALSIGLQWSGDPDQSISEEEVDVVQHSGATFYRMLLTRARTANGTDWTYYDLLFERASKRGITILPYLLQGSGVYPGPSLYADWGSWVKKVIQRYGSGGKFWSEHSSIPYMPVNTWEVWNEPNKPENNPGGVRDPEAFASFFIFSSTEIHAVQPGAQVLVGGLYLGNWTEPSMEDYVSRMYNVSGMASAINGLAIHPYGFTSGQQITEFANEVINIRTVLNRRPLGSSKPLWITELGWPVEYEYAVDPPTQAELLRLSFNWVKSVAASYNIQALTWHNARDYPTEKWDFHSGLRDLNGLFRPAWYSFQEQTGAARWPDTWMSVAPRAGDRALVACRGTQLGDATCSVPLWPSNAGTDVSVTTLGDGSAAVAFNGAGAQLSQCRVTSFLGANCWSSGASIATGTSPAVTTLTGGAASGTAIAAFNTPSTALQTCQLTSSGPANCANQGWVLAAGSNPSIAPFGDGSGAVAFRGAAGQLSECRVTWSGGSNCWSSGVSMSAGTMPGIAQVTAGAAAGSTVVAFRTPSGALETCQLTTTGPANCANQGWVLASGSSPAVAALSDGSVAVGFNGASGQFSQCRVTWSGGSNCWTSGVAMTTGTTPATTPLYTGTAMAAFRNSSGRLGTCELTTTGPTHCADHGWAVAAGTSPSASPFSDGSASIVFAGGGEQLSACRVTAPGGSNCWSEPETLASLTNPKVARVP